MQPTLKVKVMTMEVYMALVQIGWLPNPYAQQMGRMKQAYTLQAQA